MEAVLEPLMKKFFDQKLGHFVEVGKDNMLFSPGSGQISMTKAKIRPEVFDQLHIPFTIKGGYMDEVTVHMPTSGFGLWGTEQPAKVVINNVFLVFGPHTTDWSYQHVYDCKSKLIDLAMKVYDLKPPKKKAAAKAGAKGGFMADMKNRMIEDIKKKFLGMLEVNISGVHIRYEDIETQAVPFTGGFKVGFVEVKSSQQTTAELRTSGNWKHSNARNADPLFSQVIKARRISTYWDLGKAKEDMVAPRPTNGDQVFTKMRKLNIREAFSACVVEKILTLFPPEHRRRKFLEGPGFRERLDFHQYVLFPASLNAHVLVNRNDEATKMQKAPQKDADVVFDPLEVAVDSEQVRSMNQLLLHVTEFQRKDRLFRSRPREEIKQYLPRVPSSSSTAPSLVDGRDARRKKLVRDWWQHAWQGVRILCAIPRSALDADELKNKASLKDTYIHLANDAASAEKAQASGAVDSSGGTVSTATELRDKLRVMQMQLPLVEALEWRNAARDLRKEEPKEEDAPEAGASIPTNEPEDSKEEVVVPGANTLQVHVHFRAFQAYFLVVADRMWKDAVTANVPRISAAPAPKHLGTGFSSGFSLTRQLVVKAQMLDMQLEMVQKSRAKCRMARWIEFGIGVISVTNCNAKRSQHSVRQMLSMAPFEHRPGLSLCVFVGLTMFEVHDKDIMLEKGDATIDLMLEPSQGTAAHLQELSPEEKKNALRKLGFLKDYGDEVGRLMTFGFVRAGQVRALDYTPFRRRLLYFLKRGRQGPSTDLVRRPSPLALDRELLVKLQRKVQALTGKSNMLGFVECMLDGVRGRLVDHYNSQHVLCKEVSLAPMRLKAYRNGCPQTFHVQFHHLVKDQQSNPTVPSVLGDSFGLLPWKVAMLLLPKGEFQMGLSVDQDPAVGQKLDIDPALAAKSKSPAKSDKSKKGDGKKEQQEAKAKEAAAASQVCGGAVFTKWNRNGRSKRRFVQYDEQHDAIIWKDSAEDTKIVGAIPLHRVQDIKERIVTPVALKAQKHAKFVEEHILSIITAERTLDLQADKVETRDAWVLGLKSYYERKFQNDEPKLPKEWEKSARSKEKYPEKFRSQDCGLRSTYRKLSALTSLGKTLAGQSTVGAADTTGGSQP